MNEHEKLVQNYLNSDDSNRRNLLPSVLAVIVMTKIYYHSNKELYYFTENVLGANYKEYLFKSRTLLLSRIIKDYYLNEKNASESIKNIVIFLNKNISKDSDTKVINQRKKKQKEVIDGWRKVIDSI